MRQLIVKTCIFIAISVHIPMAYAIYNIQFMNNTQNNLYLTTECSGNGDGNDCATPSGKITLPAFKRNQIFTINYSQGMKSGKLYTLKSYFTEAPKEEAMNFISVTFEGDWVGSHIQSIDVTINGQVHNLLNSSNSSGKVLPDELGQFTYGKNNEYTIYATAQHDRLSDQGIDSIYLTVNKNYQVFASEDNPNEISLMTYNIQAFPNYMGVALDLNKLDTRMDYLSTKAKIQNYDVIAFEEAWDRDSRNKIKTNLAKNYPYSLDPVPINTHGALLNSGLLVLSKYPIIESKYIDYLDYQYLVDADKFTNKGAIYFKINKKGRDYNLIVTHTQAQDDSSAISTRQQEFNLIYNYLIKDANLNISPKDPLILMGDLNTDYYTSSQYNYMKAALNLNDSWIKNTIYTDPIYSYDPKLNLMIDSSITVQGLYDYLIPLNGYLLPQKVDYQIIPIRAVDYAPMYQKSHNEKLYSYGDVETSDHFMLQGRFFFSNESAD